MSGYLSGLSSPSVIEISTTFACSPKSNNAGQIKLPTFSIKQNYHQQYLNVPSVSNHMSIQMTSFTCLNLISFRSSTESGWHLVRYVDRLQPHKWDVHHLAV